MLDVNYVRANFDVVRTRLEQRGFPLDELDRFTELDEVALIQAFALCPRPEINNPSVPREFGAIEELRIDPGRDYGCAFRNKDTMIEDVFDTPQLFSLRHPLQYNRTRGAGVPAAVAGAPANFLNYWQDASRVIYATGGLLELFLRFVTGNASDTNPPTANITRYSTPGLTLVQALSASQLMFPPNEALQVQLPPSNNLTGASGFAKPERACAIFYGSTQYVNWPYLGDGNQELDA